MEYSNAFSFLIIALSYNETIIGKIWLAVVIFLRFMVIFLAAYPLYQDEQERFICNTLQPGCSNVCYDLFAPVSHFRFWLIQSVSVLLPYVIFGVYILHGVVRHIVKAASSPYSQYKEIKTFSGCKISKNFKSLAKKRKIGRRNEMAALDFSRAYIIHLIVRILLEAGFGTGHYYLFGFFVPKRFSCDRFPCTSFVDCYISRPTEKTIMMLFIWGIGGFSFLLSLVDLIFALRTNGVRNRRNKLLLQKFNAEEENSPDLQQDINPGNIQHGSMATPDGGVKCLLATEDCPFPSTMTLQQTIGSHLNSNHNKLCNESSNQDLLFNEAKQRENPSEQSRHEHQSYFVKEPLAFKSQEFKSHHSSHSFASYDKPSVHYSTLERKTSDTQSICDSSEYSKSKKSEWV
ncbi:gap junction delta-4 protein-like [Ahaetulla prasina]|uniref:gap junction delta-4 protein-like n=1 Tax=Ahaetulla prasina TaxID=499056 RepID=UPI0026497C98|nr:gap junction delta-4 protein-like [Ahaetulla prasina]